MEIDTFQLLGAVEGCTVGKLQDFAAAYLIFIVIAALGAEGYCLVLKIPHLILNSCNLEGGSTVFPVIGPH